MDEKLIAARFKKAIKSYEKNAVVQKIMSEKLFHKVLEVSNKFNSILEFGCGTGFITNQILEKLEFNELILNDIVEDYCKLHKDKSSKIIIDAGNIEEIIGKYKSFDLIISNATFQWLQDKKNLIDKFHSKLSDSGLLAFTSFGKDNYKEIKNTFGVGLEYLTKSEYKNILKDKFEILYSYEEKIELQFDNLLEVLRHIKLTGVNGIVKLSLNISLLEEYKKKYLVNNSINSYILTYNPLYFVGKKK